MKHLKTFNEAAVPLSSDGQGEYPTEVFDKFMRELIDTMEWSDEDTPSWKRVQITMPSKSGRNVSSISQSKEEALDHWEEALAVRGKDKNPAWYVWVANVGGSLNKPKRYSKQRFDIDSIMDIVRKYPDSVHRINVDMDSLEQGDFATMMSKEYYSGKPGSYSGD